MFFPLLFDGVDELSAFFPRPFPKYIDADAPFPPMRLVSRRQTSEGGQRLIGVDRFLYFVPRNGALGRRKIARVVKGVES